MNVHGKCHCGQITRCVFIFVIGSLFACETIASTTEDCADIPGVEVLFDRPSTRVIWVGEMHGTVEMPAMFGDLVCIASTRGRPVVVALERSQNDQALWDDFMTSDGTQADRDKLLNGVDSKSQDGRSSEAMFVLAERLRKLKHQGRIIGVQLIVAPKRLDSDQSHFLAEHEAGMAHSVMEARRKQPDALVLVYSGMVHAQNSVSPFDSSLRVAASLIPETERISMDLIGDSGEFWACTDRCKIQAYEGSDHPRGVLLASEAKSIDDASRAYATGYDVVGYIGMKLTASKPVAQLW
jgi:hypothetical protein